MTQELLNDALADYRSTVAPHAADVPGLDGFGDAGCALLSAAGQEAWRLRHGRIGTEHLLLALAGEQGGDAAGVLAGLGAAHERVWEALLELVPRGRRRPSMPVRRTTRGRRALALARQEAADNGVGLAEPAHILLGLVREAEGMALLGLDRDEEGMAGRALEQLGVSLATLMRSVTTTGTG